MSKDYNLKAIRQDFKSKGIFYTTKELALYLKSFLPGRYNTGRCADCLFEHSKECPEYKESEEND